jgi:hypothetical protein
MCCHIATCENDQNIIVEWNKYFIKHNKRWNCDHEDLTHLSLAHFEKRVTLVHKKLYLAPGVL